MSSQTDYIREQRRVLMQARAQVEKQFYYMEQEALLRRPAPEKWNLVEIFEHLNIYNFYYLRKFRKALIEAPDLENDDFNHGWLGKKFIEATRPKEGKVRYKISTFPSSDPRRLQEKGKRNLKAGVVFRDFTDGMDQLIELFDKWEGKDAAAIKISTYMPLIRLKVIDAMGFLTAHLQRHLVQAEKTAEMVGEG